MNELKTKTNELERMYEDSKSPADYASRYLGYVSELFKTLDVHVISEIIEVLDKARLEKRRIFVIGNGGSAATAYHYVNDFGVGCLTEGQKPFRILSLTDNVPNMTALANDSGYENIFVGQLKGLFDPKDVLVGLSVSGNSPNIVKAVEYCREVGGFSIGLVGFDGGKMKQLCDVCLHVQTAPGEYGPVEDIHLVLDHLMSSFLKMRIQNS